MPGTRSGAEMGFFDHLETLRRGIVASLVVFAIAASAVFFFMDDLMPLILAPADKLGIKLYALAPFEKFVAYLKASALLGAAAAVPVAAVLAASFIAPALGPRARKSIAFVLVALLSFAFAGAFLAWYAFLPFVVRFFALFAAGDGIEPMWSLSSFVSLAAGLVAATGLICLLPPILLALMRFGVLQPSTLSKGRRYAIVAIVIIAGAVTPTVDVVTQCVFGGAMWGLFEITLLLGRLIAPGRIRRGEDTEEKNG